MIRVGIFGFFNLKTQPQHAKSKLCNTKTKDFFAHES